MLLGKRPRPPMRRTTSLTEISFDLGAVEAPQAAAGNPQQQRHHQRAAPGVDARRGQQQPPQRPNLAVVADHHQDQQPQPQYQLYQHHPLPGPSDLGLDTRYLASMVSPRTSRRNSGDFPVEPAIFLRACGLCKRRLGPGKDTFMYRYYTGPPDRYLNKGNTMAALECAEMLNTMAIRETKKARRQF